MTTTIDIPGGTAELWEPRELTPRRRKPSELLATMLGRTVGQLQVAGRLVCEGLIAEDRTELLNEDGSPKFPGPDLELTRSQLALINELNDVGAWALLKSWTLDLPLPATADDFLDIPADVYDAIRTAVAKVMTESPDVATVFSPDALGDDPDTADLSLPTSASAD